MADSVSSSSISINSWMSWDVKNPSWDHGNDETKSADLPLINNKKKRHIRCSSIRSSIDVVDQNGVEVTLDISVHPHFDDIEETSRSQILSGSKEVDTTPKSPVNSRLSKKSSISPTPSTPPCLRRPMNALLDDDVAVATPASPITPAFVENNILLTASSIPDTSSDSATPRRVMFCGTVNDWCPSDALSCTPQDALKNYEWSISQSLGSPVGVQDWCHGWQALSAFPALLEEPEFNLSVPPSPTTLLLAAREEEKLHVQRSLRSRAYNVVMRRKRVDMIRLNLNPFEQEMKQTNHWNQRLAFGRTRSFNLTRITPPPKEPTPKPEKVISLVSVLECGALDCSTSFDAETPASIRKDHELRYYDQGYDSDPEDFTSFHRRNRPSPTNKENRNTFTAINDRMRFPDLDNLSVLVQDFLNERTTLLWHRDVQKYPGSTSSVAVNVWVERGQRLNRDVLLPKLCWMPLSASNQSNTTTTNQILHQSEQTCSVELLDISRVLETIKVDRSRYPFVRLPCSFVLRTLHDEYILEASSPQERNRLVQTIKHVVARFASTVLLQDEKAILEFFASRLQGPGEMPRVFTGN